MRPTGRTACLLTAALLALAAGCGGDDDGGDVAADPAGTSTTTAGADATTSTEVTGATDDEPAAAAVCPLLDGVDLAALLGEPAGEPTEGNESCEVESASADSRGGLSLVVSTNSAAENYDNRAELFGIDSEAPGFGDQAFHSGPYLVVLDGGTLLQLQVVPDASVGFGVEDALLEAAMTTILTNLG